MPTRVPLPPTSFRRARIIAASLVACALLTTTIPHAASAQGLINYMRLNTTPPSGTYGAVANKLGLQGNPDYTIEAWVFPKTHVGFPTIVGNNFLLSYWVGLNASGRVRFYPCGGAGQYVQGTAIVPLDRWTHVAVTYRTGVGWAIYLNGQLDASGNSIVGAVGTSPDSLRIGADVSGGVPAYFWSGSLAQVRIWSAALSAAAIAENRFVGAGSRNFTGPRYAALEAQWDFTRFIVVATEGWAVDEVEIAGIGATERNDIRPIPSAGEMFGSSLIPQHIPLDFNVGLELNGTDDYGELASHASYAGGVTIEAWVAPYSFAAGSTIAGRNETSSFRLGLTTSGALRFHPRGGSLQFLESNAVIPLNRWTFVAATYDPVTSTTRLFVNGQLDASTTSISGAVGENGRPIYVGADNATIGPIGHFAGMLDEVAITDGPLSDESIAARRFIGTGPTDLLASNMVNDLHGVSRVSLRFHCDRYRHLESLGVWIHGSHAKLVLSGAPMFSSSGTGFLDDADMTGMVVEQPGGLGLTVPDQLTRSAAAISVNVPSAVVIADVDAFVSLSCTNLLDLTIKLEPPSGSALQLAGSGEMDGRSLQTIFDDEGPLTLAGGIPAYCNRIQPSMPLSALDGQLSAGTWTFTFSTGGAEHFAVWAVGIRVQGSPVAVDANPIPDVWLSRTGAEPVSGHGAVQLALPRAGTISLRLHDVSGRVVRTLQEGPREAGRYDVTWSAAGLESGRYWLRLEMDGQTRGRLPVTIVR